MVTLAQSELGPVCHGLNEVKFIIKLDTTAQINKPWTAQYVDFSDVA